MKERINSQKLNQNLKEVRELLEANRGMLTTEEYLASLAAMTATQIAIDNAKEKSLLDKLLRRDV